MVRVFFGSPVVVGTTAMGSVRFLHCGPGVFREYGRSVFRWSPTFRWEPDTREATTWRAERTLATSFVGKAQESAS